MIKIEKYKAIDGKEFNDPDQCLEYEALIDRVNTIMKPFGDRPDDSDFQNGVRGYIQHDRDVFLSVKRNILEEIGKHINHQWIKDTMERDNVHPSWVARLIGDCGIRPLDRAWFRFQCIDNQYREWGQPYFANNPHEAESQKVLT